MSQVEERVKALVLEKIADREDLFIVDVRMQSNRKLLVLIDGDQGVSIQDCAAISRHVGYHLEEEDVIDHAYQLEVSSPGLDEPLRERRQFVKNVGRNVQVTFTKEEDGVSSTHIREGLLVSLSDTNLTLEAWIKDKKLPKGRKPAVELLEIPFNAILTTKVLISFN